MKQPYSVGHTRLVEVLLLIPIPCSTIITNYTMERVEQLPWAQNQQRRIWGQTEAPPTSPLTAWGHQEGLQIQQCILLPQRAAQPLALLLGAANETLPVSRELPLLCYFLPWALFALVTILVTRCGCTGQQGLASTCMQVSVGGGMVKEWFETPATVNPSLAWRVFFIIEERMLAETQVSMGWGHSGPPPLV